jgi:hypothetical protein
MPPQATSAAVKERTTVAISVRGFIPVSTPETVFEVGGRKADKRRLAGGNLKRREDM